MTLFIADGHADSLMWNRDLNVRSTEGHVDFPRLIEAGVGLQCFTVVTRGFPFIGGFPVFAQYRGWPAEARRSPWTRALWQLDRMRDFCDASGGKVALTTTRAQLDDCAKRGVLAAVLGIEGAQALEGQVERVAELFRRGARFMSLTHLSNNALGGSSFPFMGNRGLSQHGFAVLEAMASVRMAVDLAHGADRTLHDILSNRDIVPFSSHTGIRGAAPMWRNLSDEVLRAIADRGGVACVIFGTPYLGGRTVKHVVRHIDHAIRVMGEDAVALGSDFDGMVPLPKGMKDVLGTHLVADEMRFVGYSPRRVEKVMGKNLFQFFQRLFH